MEKSLFLPILERTRPLEERLRSQVYIDPQGVNEVYWENQEKWYDVIKPLLVDPETAFAITGYNYQCSARCYNEEGDGFH